MNLSLTGKKNESSPLAHCHPLFHSPLPLSRHQTRPCRRQSRPLSPPLFPRRPILSLEPLSIHPVLLGRSPMPVQSRLRAPTSRHEPLRPNPTKHHWEPDPTPHAKPPVQRPLGVSPLRPRIPYLSSQSLPPRQYLLRPNSRLHFLSSKPCSPQFSLQRLFRSNFH